MMVRFVDAVCRRPVSVLILGAMLAIVGTYGFCTRIEYHTRRSDLESPDKDYQRRWQAHFA